MTDRSRAVGAVGPRSALGRRAAPRIAVVIPARNEERRLSRCLVALEQADAHLRLKYPESLPTRVVIVLDRCTDGSRAVLDDWPEVEVVTSSHGQVGAARAAGARQALLDVPGHPPADWIACTDADSAVPVDWLATQLSHAMADTDLLLGLVRPDPMELEPDLMGDWIQAHQLTEGHPHVHGANFGIRAEMYVRTGGFARVAAHEDVLLAAEVRERDGLVVSTASSPVLTSARTSGRAPVGMATYLAEMAVTNGAIAS